VAKCQNVEVRCNAGERLSEVWANYERLVHALVLLLDSAITYTPSGEHVIAEVESSGPEVVFRIAQPCGKGFSDSKIRHISEIARSTAKTKGKEVGGGFALALCQEIVENHRGRFWVDEEGGTAATFHVALPAIAYEPRAARYSSDRGAAATGA
jgi:signal transduction histidine kinase